MTKLKKYDVIIIGASRAAIFLGQAFAQAGQRTALVEREYLGGTCINVGCTPTKTMVASARVAYLARRAAAYGVHTGPVTVNLAEVQQRKNSLVDELRNFPLGLIEQSEGLDLIMGEAGFTGPSSVQVRALDDTISELTADTIIIATGGRPAMPSIPGLSSVPTLNSTSILDLDTIPEHLILLGGGYLGLEFGQMFRRFGSRVTIMDILPQLMVQEDPDVAEEVTKILREDGIEVVLEANTRQVKQTEAGQVQLDIKTPKGERVLTGSHLLVVAGRVPNTNSLNLEAAGVRTDERGFVQVNEYLETNISGIFALGDVKGGPAFTPIAFDDFRILRTNLLMGGNATTKGRLVPYTVFIDPQLGRVGLSETQARAQGRNIRVAKLPMDYMGPTRAREVGETRGFMKAIIDADTDQILGAAILGLEGGEIMTVLEVAMMGKLPYTAIRDGIFAHPTLAESLNDLFMMMDMPGE